MQKTENSNNTLYLKDSERTKKAGNGIEESQGLGL